MHSDPTADMLTRIRNAQAVAKKTVDVPFSKFNQAILNLLKEHNYIGGIKTDDESKITVSLAYIKKGQPKIEHLKKISRPGRHIYVTHAKLPIVLNNYGIAIISTSQGLMTNKQARAENLGGEVICEIY